MKTLSHTIKSLFKVHDTVISGVFRVVQLSSLLLEHFHHPKETCTPQQPPPAPGSRRSKFCLPAQSTPCKWSRSIHAVACLASPFGTVWSCCQHSAPLQPASELHPLHPSDLPCAWVSRCRSPPQLRSSWVVSAPVWSG